MARLTSCVHKSGDDDINCIWILANSSSSSVYLGHALPPLAWATLACHDVNVDVDGGGGGGGVDRFLAWKATKLQFVCACAPVSLRPACSQKYWKRLMNEAQHDNNSNNNNIRCRRRRRLQRRVAFGFVSFDTLFFRRIAHCAWAASFITKSLEQLNELHFWGLGRITGQYTRPSWQRSSQGSRRSSQTQTQPHADWRPKLAGDLHKSAANLFHCSNAMSLRECDVAESECEREVRGSQSSFQQQQQQQQHKRQQLCEGRGEAGRGRVRRQSCSQSQRVSA